MFFNKKLFLIANNEFLNNDLLKAINYEDAGIVHFNSASMLWFFKEKYDNYLVLNNFVLGGGGYHHYKSMLNTYENYKKIIFATNSENIADEPWKSLVEKCPAKEKEILNTDVAYTAFSKTAKNVACASVGYSTIRYIKEYYPDIEINLVGFIGGYRRQKSGKKYGIGHQWQIEQQYIKTFIPEKNIFYGDISFFENKIKNL